MMQHVYKPKRRRGGRLAVGVNYWGRYRVEGMGKPVDVALRTRDKQVAEHRLREIVLERQREAAGIVAPRRLREGAQKLMSEHLSDYVADLRARGKSDKYVNNVRLRLLRLAGECGWVLPADATPDSFIVWRSCNASKAAKTLKDYLAAASALFAWMGRNGRLSANPLKGVDGGETRGKEKRKRRALTDDEVRRLLAVSGERRAVYLLALRTGLRRAELDHLRWGDVHLEALHPFLNVRASTTKNHKAACMPLLEDAAAALRCLHVPDVSPGQAVFAGRCPSMKQWKLDLAAAGIVYVDELGRQADFHSLRHTLATGLARGGVEPRVAMELMRHSEMRLTQVTYTDAALLPVREGLERLPDYGEQVASGLVMATGTDGKSGTRKDTLFQGSPGQSVSAAVMTGKMSDVRNSLQKQGESALVSSAVVMGQGAEIVRHVGLEPTTR